MRGRRGSLQFIEVRMPLFSNKVLFSNEVCCHTHTNEKAQTFLQKRPSENDQVSKAKLQCRGQRGNRSG